MRILIAGSSGLIGGALRPALASRGDEVVPLLRSPAGDGPTWDPTTGRLDAAAIRGFDAVINLAGVGIGDRRWSAARKKLVLDSRLQTTSLLAETIASLGEKPSVFVNASAIGYYGDRGDEELTEESPPGSDFVSELCVQWEQATAAASDAGVRTVRLRTGLVLSGTAGILPKMLVPFRLGAGGVIGSGAQYWSWITIDDEVAAILHILDGGYEGPVNLTAPNPLPFRDVVGVVGRVLRRPTFLRAPSFALRALLGKERAEGLLFSGQRVLPKKLLAAGFRFSYPDLESGLRHVLDRSA